MTKQPTIVRIWRGRTPRERADEYESYNYEIGIKPLIEKALGEQTLREDRETETEFLTISYWEDVESMGRFTDKEFLIELPTHVQILEIRSSNGLTVSD